MNSNFKFLCQECGLMSIDDASHFLNIRRQTCQEFWYGETMPPQGIVDELHDELVLSNNIKVKISKMSKAELMEFIYGGE